MRIDHGVATRTLSKPIPERIKEAREARGYTLESFAEALDRSKQAVAQYETGQTVPSGEILSKIVALTSQPLSFFTHVPTRAGSTGTIFWRGLKRMEQHHRNRIGRRLQWAADITALVDEFVELPSPNIPQYVFDPELGRLEEIEDAAEYLRNYWGLGGGPIVDLARILESNGVIIVRENVACSDMDGVSCWISGRPYILLSGEVVSGPRDLYSLAHELGHIFLHSSVNITNDNLQKIERQADRFASAFLMPQRTFSREVLGTSVEYFKTLKMRWGVSIAAMAYRCKSLDLITENQYSYIFRQMNYQNIRKIEPYDDYFKVCNPDILAEAVKMIVDNDVFGRHDIENRLGLNLRDVESICGVEAGYLDEKVVRIKFRTTVNDNNA